MFNFLLSCDICISRISEGNSSSGGSIVDEDENMWDFSDASENDEEALNLLMKYVFLTI